MNHPAPIAALAPLALFAALPASGAVAAGAVVPAVSEAAAPVRERIEVVGRAADDAGEAARRSSLGREELRLLPAETLAEAMSALPGLVIYFSSPFGGTPMVVQRGFFGGGEVDYLGLEVDGVPRAATETGVADWSGLRLEEVERIDLLAGPAMRHGGVDPALAGHLRVQTRQPDGSRRGSAGLSAASFDTRTGQFGYSGGAGTWSGFFAADARQTGGYRESNSANEEGGGSLILDRLFGESHRLHISAYGRWRDREEPGPLSESELAADPLSSNPLFDDDRERAGQWAATLRFDGPFAGVPLEGHLVADGRRSRFLRTLLVAEGYGDRALREVETATWSAGASTPGEIALGSRAGLRLAADYRSEEADTRYESGGGEQRAADLARRERFASEAGLALRPFSRLELDLSVRGDVLRDRSDSSGGENHEAWSPRLSAVWSADTAGAWGYSVFGEIGRAFKAPTLDQLYDPRPFFGPDGEFTLSNPELEPQESRGWELGARGHFPRGSWRLVAYRQILENEIDFDPATFRYSNIGRSRHQGVETSATWQAGRAGTFRAVYARSEAEPEGDSPGGQLKNIPRDVLRLGWGVRVAGFDLTLQQSFLGGRWADDAHTRPLDDLRRTDLRVARQVGVVRLRADVLNVFDDETLELAYLLPAADGLGETLHGFAPAPRAFRLGVETSW